MFSAFLPLGAFFPSFSELLHAWPIILSLILIEGLLSVDNALAIAAMANHLPEKQRVVALRLGIIGAYVFRGVALAFAAWIVHYSWVMWGGAAYLLYLMSQHFVDSAEAESNQLAGVKMAGRSFFATIVSIEIMDLSLSVDNVVAAAAMSSDIWVLCTGVFIGILALRVVAGRCLKLIDKYPVLEHTAFLLIGFVGLILVVELTWLHFTGYKPHLPAWQKFIGIVFILLLSIWYSRSAAVHATLKPLIAAAHIPMRALTVVVGTLLNLVFAPFKFLLSVFHRPGEMMP